MVGLVDDEHVHAQRFELDARQRLVVARLLAVSQALFMAVSALLRAASSRLTVGSLSSPLALAAASTAWANSSTRARMFLSRRSLLTCSWLNRLSGTITASQSPVATRPQKRLTDSGLRCASLSMTRTRPAG